MKKRGGGDESSSFVKSRHLRVFFFSSPTEHDVVRHDMVRPSTTWSDTTWSDTVQVFSYHIPSPPVLAKNHGSNRTREQCLPERPRGRRETRLWPRSIPSALGRTDRMSSRLRCRPRALGELVSWPEPSLCTAFVQHLGDTSSTTPSFTSVAACVTRPSPVPRFRLGSFSTMAIFPASAAFGSSAPALL